MPADTVLPSAEEIHLTHFTTSEYVSLGSSATDDDDGWVIFLQISPLSPFKFNNGVNICFTVTIAPSDGFLHLDR